MKKRRDFIQGIRGIAILLIFVAHTRSYLTENEKIIDVIEHWGGIGVYFFLVLSGFLFSLNASRKVELSGVGYVRKNAKKLYWLHFITFVIVVIIKFDQIIIEPTRYIIYTVFNLLLLQDYIPFSGIINSFNGPSWYLSMMTFIWFMTPTSKKIYNWILTRLTGVKTLIIILLVQIFYFAVVHFVVIFIEKNFEWINTGWYISWLVYFNPLLCYSVYFLGAFSAGMSIPSNRSVRNFVLSVLLINALFIYQDGNLFHLIMGELSVLYLIRMCFEDDKMKERLSVKPLLFVGDLSSYIFLIHGPVNFILRFDGAIPVGMKFIISFTITVLVSMFVKKMHMIVISSKLEAI